MTKTAAKKPGSKPAGPYAMFKTNRQAEQEGVVLDYGSFKIRVLRAGPENARFQRVMEAKLKPHRRLLNNNMADMDVIDRLIREAYAETIVIGWEGVTDEEGTELPCNKENALKLFTDLPDLFRDVRDQAASAALFREHVLELDAKN